ncbi:hypothetical protein GCM10010304_01660 [Streptomyces roseoviolaceus]
MSCLSRLSSRLTLGGERQWDHDLGAAGESFAEDGVLGEEGDEDGRCGINLLLKSLALLPVAPPPDDPLRHRRATTPVKSSAARRVRTGAAILPGSRPAAA